MTQYAHSILKFTFIHEEIMFMMCHYLRSYSLLQGRVYRSFQKGGLKILKHLKIINAWHDENMLIMNDNMILSCW